MHVGGFLTISAGHDSEYWDSIVVVRCSALDDAEVVLGCIVNCVTLVLKVGTVSLCHKTEWYMNKVNDGKSNMGFARLPADCSSLFLPVSQVAVYQERQTSPPLCCKSMRVVSCSAPTGRRCPL